MYVSEAMIAEAAEQFGEPERVEFRINATPAELDRIKSSQRNGRNHDVTLYIHKDDRIVVIAKPMYPPGLYRAPSGGLKPGERIIDGIDREVAEETGCRIKVEKFLLRTDVSFVCDRVASGGSESIYWRSFVFEARYVSGDFRFTDTDEISEVRLARLDEFEEFSRIMRSMQTGGLYYRADLHDKIKLMI